MSVDYFNTNDSDGDLGYFIGLVEDSIWSNPEIESKGKADYDNADRYQLYWNVKVLDILQEDFDDDVENTTVTMSIGKGWYPEDNKVDIRHEDDPGDAAVEAGEAKPIFFSGAARRGSVYGKFLAVTRGASDGFETGEGEAEVLDGGDEVDYDLTGVLRYMRKNGITDPRNSSVWEGHVFLFRGLGLRYNRDQKPRLKALPTKWLGTLEQYEKNEGVSVDRSQGGGVKASGMAAPETVANILGAGVSPEAVEAITSAVNASNSHTEFAKTALVLPEVRANEALTPLIMDEENGPWSARV